MLRSTSVAGMFYESDFGKLDKQVESCFLSKLGPGDLPSSKREKKIYGIIVPHAGYPFSGPCAAWGYKELGEAKLPGRYVIIGVNHSGFASSKIATLDQGWNMPFGVVKPDNDLINDLVKVSKHVVRVDSKAHFNEHSIEVQLPFLQFVNKDKLKDLRIVPLIVNDLVKGIGKAIAKCSKDVIVIGSSDFTHYGVNYNYVPFSTDVKEKIYEMDGFGIDLILKLKTKEFLEYAQDKTICGAGAIALTMEIVKNLGCSKARLLRYYTSGDVSKDYKNAVGYGAIVFE